MEIKQLMETACRKRHNSQPLKPRRLRRAKTITKSSLATIFGLPFAPPTRKRLSCFINPLSPLTAL
ncbi:MAG: hypothetical protein H0W58_14755 [Acidobacteria bacterium]|nr:hypothetical protein [Acidobacteriota bacterium]